MQLKNLCALFLLSVASVYFICPVQCTGMPGVAESAAFRTTSIYQQYLLEPLTPNEMSSSTCCETEDLPSPTHERQGDIEGHCCFDRWESLGMSEPQFTSQVQKGTSSFVVLIPVTSTISSGSISFALHFRLPYNPYTDPPALQLSPRAPPFVLA